MTKFSDVETVVRIMMAFRSARARRSIVKPSVLEYELPASLSMESEALCIIKSIQTGIDMTEEFIGHHRTASAPIGRE